MRTVIVKALELKYQGAIAEAKANIEIYLTNSVGIGEHPEILSAIDTQVEVIAELKYRWSKLSHEKMAQVTALRQIV